MSIIQKIGRKVIDKENIKPITTYENRINDGALWIGI